MKKFIMGLIITSLTLTSFLTTSVLATSLYSDVNSDHWAYESIEKASKYGIMNGMGDGTFGMGETLKRGEFASLLVRMFGWDVTKTEYPTFEDNSDKNKWYYNAIETLYSHGVVDKEIGKYRPEENITREEIAVMLVKALGYTDLAESVKNTGIPFTDVYSNKGYITIAYDFGIISGKTSNAFEPQKTALREEVAAMMIRAYDRYNSKIDFLHGFYAFSSWNQKNMAAKMDSVSLGWSRMEYSPKDGVVLNTTSANNNEWFVPSGYEDAINFLEDNNVNKNLDIYMSASETVEGLDGNDVNPCKAILIDSDNRQAAINAIIEELTVDYKKTGYNIYEGVTIDFENLKGNDVKEGFTQFLKDLKIELNKINKKLYVAVQPKLKNSSEYFNGYDYKAIGSIADKVIIMAHDYAPNVINSSVMESGFTTTPVTPFDEVYYAMKSIINEVENKDKLVLALSMNSAGWTKKNGQIINAKPFKPFSDEINKKIKQGATYTYSQKYRNPYITYTDEEGEHIVWYEDEKSINDKIKLSKMFGINSISIWRLGIIPENSENNMNVWQAIINN